MFDEPCCRKTIFVAFRAAALDLWGEAGLDAIADRVDRDTRVQTIEPLVITREWLPERFVMAWYEAAWEGPADRRSATYLTFLDRMMDNGFGRVRKALLGFATPTLIATKSAELWRHDHSTGEVRANSTGERSLTVTLRDHVYVSTPLARLSVAEIFRYAASLSRTREVGCTHSANGPNELVCWMIWR